jgi:hypothetical protein
MRINRGTLALTGAAIAVAGFMLSPAIGARGSFQDARSAAPLSLGALGGSAFTPSIKDPGLAAAYAKIAGSSAERNFRFTPTSGSLSGGRSLTVMVRADKNGVPVSRTIDPIDIKPVAFSLNGAHSWRKFALPESVGRKALDPVAIEGLDARGFSLEKGGDKGKDRFSTKAVVETRREPGLRNPGADKDYTLDLASSYSLTRNLNVTAGIRYNNGAPGRLAPITDDRQDAQAVYLGTVFKF